MSTDTDTTTDEEEPVDESLDADAVAQLAQAERRAKKSMTFETEAGQATYVYQMIREGRLAELSEKHFETPDVRGRDRANDPDINEDDYERFRAEVISEAIVEAPQGTKLTQQYIRKSIPDRWQSKLFDAITDFSTMDDETFCKFLVS